MAGRSFPDIRPTTEAVRAIPDVDVHRAERRHGSAFWQPASNCKLQLTSKHTTKSPRDSAELRGSQWEGTMSISTTTVKSMESGPMTIK